MNEPNNPNSIMDWFKRHGLDGSYKAREKLFSECGFSNYKGTPEQNILLLNFLKSEFGP